MRHSWTQSTRVWRNVSITTESFKLKSPPKLIIKLDNFTRSFSSWKESLLNPIPERFLILHQPLHRLLPCRYVWPLLRSFLGTRVSAELFFIVSHLTGRAAALATAEWSRDSSICQSFAAFRESMSKISSITCQRRFTGPHADQAAPTTCSGLCHRVSYCSCR